VDTVEDVDGWQVFVHGTLFLAWDTDDMPWLVANPAQEKVKLGRSRPGQQILDQEMKRFTHSIRMAAVNTADTLAREIRTNTGFQRADRESPLRTPGVEGITCNIITGFVKINSGENDAE
jgi:hypothetical protein